MKKTPTITAKGTMTAVGPSHVATFITIVSQSIR